MIIALNGVFPVCLFESLKSPVRSYAFSFTRQAPSGGVAPRETDFSAALHFLFLFA